MDMKIIGYALVAGISAGLTYLLFPRLVAAPPGTPIGVSQGMTTRWTSGYHGPASYNGTTGIYPEAGIAEMLYPYGEMHKATQYSPYATTANAAQGLTANGSLVYID